MIVRTLGETHKVCQHFFGIFELITDYPKRRCSRLENRNASRAKAPPGKGDRAVLCVVLSALQRSPLGTADLYNTELVRISPSPD